MNDRIIVDDLLPADICKKIYDELTWERFTWGYSDVVSDRNNDPADTFYFYHVFYMDHRPVSNFFNIISPILDVIKPKAILKIKANLYTCTPYQIKHGYHNDQPFDVKSLLYFVNDNDGVTTFEDTGEEIQSKANRGLFFNSKDRHCSSTPTDAKIRLTINFNYF